MNGVCESWQPVQSNVSNKTIHSSVCDAYNDSFKKKNMQTALIVVDVFYGLRPRSERCFKMS